MRQSSSKCLNCATLSEYVTTACRRRHIFKQVDNSLKTLSINVAGKHQRLQKQRHDLTFAEETYVWMRTKSVFKIGYGAGICRQRYHATHSGICLSLRTSVEKLLPTLQCSETLCHLCVSTQRSLIVGV